MRAGEDGEALLEETRSCKARRAGGSGTSVKGAAAGAGNLGLLGSGGWETEGQQQGTAGHALTTSSTSSTPTSHTTSNT